MTVPPPPWHAQVDRYPVPEGRFRALFAQAPVSIQILAPDGSTLAVNRAWEELWQIRRGSALLDHVLSPAYNVFTDPQLVASGIAPLLARACAGEPVELPVIRYDVAALGGAGPARWVSARAHPVTDDSGATVEVMLMHEDVTARIEAEQALRSREERFRSLVMASSHMVWTTTADGWVVEDSPSWRLLTGQSYDEWKAHGWLDALHPDDRQPTLDLWRACVASAAVFETEYRVRCADGSYRWTAVKGVPIKDASGVVREWIGANTDIHEVVVSRLEQAQRLERERRNSALLTKVAHASRVLHMALSSERIAQALVAQVRDILEVHQAVVSLTEDDDWSQAINAVSLSDKYARYRDYAARTSGQGIYAQVCSSNRVMRLTQQELEAHPAWKAFGTEGHAHPPMRGWLAAPLIDRNGNNIGLIQVSDKVDGDFTEEDEAILVQLASIAANGFENARLYGALQEQHRSKDEFLAMLAHELRNPLAPIATAAHILKLCSAADARVAHASDVVSRQVRHLAALVDDLLDVSRVTRGLIQLRSETVDLMAIVDGAIEQSRPLVDARRHTLRLAAAPAAPLQVVGDPNRLVQVFANLLNNAAKYTPPGGAITLGVTADESTATVTVRDNGIGIERRLLPRVFELFTQAERTPDRAQGGLGIGLALVKTIVTLHGGTVTARSDGPGTGSEFAVVLGLAGRGGS